MKNKEIIVPLVLAGIVLILVLATAVTKKDFKRSPAETIKLASLSKHLIGPGDIASLRASETITIKIGSGNLKAFPSEIETKDLDLGQILSSETKSVLKNNKKKILFSANLSDAVKAWTFLTRMGYTELYVYDPEMKNSAGKNDTTLQGNETFQYTFKPEQQ